MTLPATPVSRQNVLNMLQVSLSLISEKVRGFFMEI